MKRILTIALSTAAIISCAGVQTRSTTSAASEVASDASGTIAQIYYWRAKPGKFEEYTRYVRDVAEPIDEGAHRRGALRYVTTYVTQDNASICTHMRVFLVPYARPNRGVSEVVRCAS